MIFDRAAFFWRQNLSHSGEWITIYKIFVLSILLQDVNCQFLTNKVYYVGRTDMAYIYLVCI